MGDKRNILTVELSDEEMADLDSVRGLPDGGMVSRSAVVRQALKEFVEFSRENEATQTPVPKVFFDPVAGGWLNEYPDGTVAPSKPDTSERITYQSPYRAPDGSYPGSKPPPPSPELPSLDGYAKEAAKSLGIEELD